MKNRPVRLATRAIILQDARLLLVNAYSASRGSDLWCAPGGGVQSGQSLPANLRREVYEETGLTINVGEIALVNEFHDPISGFHQVDLFFRCVVTKGEIDNLWKDLEHVVTTRRYFTYADLKTIRLKPNSLPDIAFGPSAPAHYDMLERIIL